METHAGYMGGLKREFCANTTLPYYATSSEEVIFHVSTRMPSKGRDVEQKVIIPSPWNRVSYRIFDWRGELGGPLKPRPPDLTPAK